jgi:hypothetical protein
VHFEKARGFHGQAAQPFEARYEVRDGVAVWTRAGPRATATAISSMGSGPAKT